MHRRDLVFQKFSDVPSSLQRNSPSGEFRPSSSVAAPTAIFLKRPGATFIEICCRIRFSPFLRRSALYESRVILFQGALGQLITFFLKCAAPDMLRFPPLLCMLPQTRNRTDFRPNFMERCTFAYIAPSLPSFPPPPQRRPPCYHPVREIKYADSCLPEWFSLSGVESLFSPVGESVSPSSPKTQNLLPPVLNFLLHLSRTFPSRKQPLAAPTARVPFLRWNEFFFPWQLLPSLPPPFHKVPTLPAFGSFFF